jgi:hypothetical protein
MSERYLVSDAEWVCSSIAKQSSQKQVDNWLEEQRRLGKNPRQHQAPMWEKCVKLTEAHTRLMDLIDDDNDNNSQFYR